MRRSESELVLVFVPLIFSQRPEVVDSEPALMHMHHGGSKLYGREEVCLSVFFVIFHCPMNLTAGRIGMLQKLALKIGMAEHRKVTSRGNSWRYSVKNQGSLIPISHRTRAVPSTST